MTILRLFISLFRPARYGVLDPTSVTFALRDAGFEPAPRFAGKVWTRAEHGR